jgi:serine protease AprX
LNVKAASEASTPTAAQSFTKALGTGLLEGARGSAHVADSVTGIELTGEKDIMGQPWKPGTWTATAAAGISWTGGTWNGNLWAGTDWTGTSWTARTWSARTWSARTWSGSTWSARTWSGSTWSARTWSGGYWSSTTWK